MVPEGLTSVHLAFYPATQKSTSQLGRSRDGMSIYSATTLQYRQYLLPYLVSDAVLHLQNLYFHYKTLSKYMLLKYAMTVIYNGLIDQKKRRAFLEYTTV